eukprot:CAMPEP_0201972854 /NCGR_PEP_ID=MMETSP0904-20121228/43561_1 /ASSEMBLY_ACC=CAM_ASM_000553 /TAXON_ID=420261 /ORGANISM="Thalassiosira antarctica, Strain CCMP982" /LENGTH=49 /DNA_ID= /DNA_START= /DNA_END= /DNA_ORIENTATION=
MRWAEASASYVVAKWGAVWPVEEALVVREATLSSNSDLSPSAIVDEEEA